MKIKQFFAFCCLIVAALNAHATLEMKATYYDKDGAEVVVTAGEGSEIRENAPLHVSFTSNPSDFDSGVTFEWHITNQATGTNITRYEQDIEFDFMEAGTTVVTVSAMAGGEAVESASISVIISESVLEMPNAFSPNDDQINDTYQAKSTSKSIVEFHGYIFNRYGQKLFDWTNWQDSKGGWDGSYNGRPVKDGVYYVYVKARGADGVVYNIRRDVNLIRNHNQGESSTSSDSQ